ncbi:hypothetical protein [Hyphomicrobium sp.]|uniref:hypothetical protein n=1 Tax=Hyphomicrobium sp. TaxID=82 RepID=UPI002E300787|nr:hypothetical protein [Hyphomicrobium sp.]HEX2839737.1 hypothetical protein [Hyphomicrobium sp.]
MAFPKKLFLTGIAVVVLASPTLAADRMTDSLKQQYLTGEEMKQRGAAGDQGAIGATKPNSGPGVQGPAGTRTGPAAREAEDSASSGTSSGESGTGANTTQPSQDSSGVQGFPDTRTGPSTHRPSDTE